MNQLNEVFSINNGEHDINETLTLDDAPVKYNDNAIAVTDDNLIQDIDYTRRTLQFTVERSQQLIELALHNAADSASPRDIEVATNALNTCAAVSEKLIQLHEQIKKLSNKNNSQDCGTGNTFVNNNNKTIVLTSAELLKNMLEEKSDI